MRGREIFLLGSIAVLVVVLLRQPQNKPRFTVLRGVVRALTLVLFAEEPPAEPSLQGYGQSQDCSATEIGAPPTEATSTEGYASLNHGNGW